MQSSLLMLKNITKDDIHEVGEKSVRLAALCNRFSVPIGFVIKKQSFDKFLKHTGIDIRIRNLLSSIKLEDKENLQNVANGIQKLIVNGILPDPIQEEILENYNCLIEDTTKLNQMLNSKKGPLVAVRASTCGYEDYSKMHLNFLNIEGNKRLLNALQACWASFYTAKAIEHRMKNNIQDSSMAVIVQNMVNSHLSGAAYSTNPTNHEQILIVACKGLGCAITSGNIMPDRYTLNKDTLAIDDTDIKKQDFLFELDKYKFKTKKSIIPPKKAAEQKLNERQIMDIALHCKRIERLFGRPQFIEFAISNDQYYVLQSQDILGMDEEKVEQVEEEVKEETAVEEKQESTTEETPIIDYWDEKEELEVKEEQPLTAEESTEQPIIETKEQESIQAEETQEVQPIEAEEETTEQLEQTQEPVTAEEAPVTEPKQEIKVNLPENTNELLSLFNQDTSEEEDTEEETTELNPTALTAAILSQKTGQTEEDAKGLLNSGSVLVNCDLAIYYALKEQYKKRFGEEDKNLDFNRLANILGQEKDLPHDEEIRKIHTMRNKFLRAFHKPTREEVDMALETTKKFIEKLD